MCFIMQYRKYEIEHTFFDTIDSQEKSYFLGLLFADGHNNVKDGVVSIDLQETDILLLQKLTDIIQPTKPIKNYENKYSKTGRARLVLANRYISNRLLALGMIQNKSEKLMFVKEIPDSLMSHFIRGYFDGNGSIGIFGKAQNVEFSLCSTKEFVEFIQNVLVNNCNLSKTKLGKRHKDRENNSYHVKYTGRFSCLKIRDYLYKDAHLYLQRKYDKFFSIPVTKKHNLN